MEREGQGKKRDAWEERDGWDVREVRVQVERIKGSLSTRYIGKGTIWLSHTVHDESLNVSEGCWFWNVIL